MRSESPILFLQFMIGLGFLFVFLALVVFRFDLVGGDIVDDDICSPASDSYTNLSKVLIPRKLGKKSFQEDSDNNVNKKVKWDDYNSEKGEK